MTTSRSEEREVVSDGIPIEWRTCESCQADFAPVSEEPLCGDCVREMFETRSSQLSGIAIVRTKSSSFDRENEASLIALKKTSDSPSQQKSIQIGGIYL
jgi:hypothetical protein